MNSEKELFKQAYMNLRKADKIPFPDAVFDEYIRLRDSEGYKLVPVEPTDEMINAASNALFDHDACTIDVYKAMIGEVDE